MIVKVLYTINPYYMNCWENYINSLSWYYDCSLSYSWSKCDDRSKSSRWISFESKSWSKWI